MRYNTIILLLLLPLLTLAQKQVQSVFNFGDPLNLNPAITPASINQGRVGVTDKTFTEGFASISFALDGGQTGAQIRTTIGSVSSSYFLAVTDLTTMTVSISNAINIKEIYLGSGSINGGLYLKTGQGGSYSPSEMKWTNDTNENITSVTFRNSGNNTETKEITVVYTIPEDVLEPTSDITEGAVIPEFSTLNLSFEYEMEVVATEGITIQKVDETNSSNLSAVANGKTISISASQSIAVDGTYRIVIPAHSFKNNAGFYNKELTYTFSIDIPKNTFSPTVTSPEQGRVSVLPLELTLSFADPVGHVVSDEMAILFNNANKAIVKMEKKSGDDKTVKLVVQNLTQPFTDEGIYTIVIPEKSIFNAYYNSTQYKSEERWNPEIVLTYEISSAPIKSETMIAAEELLGISGVGYPKTNSSARTNLKSLVEAESIPSDEELTAAIGNFYSETDIELPETERYYNISSINSTGGKLYLADVDGKIVLSDKKSDAASLKAVNNNDGTVVFQTQDGKYLHVLVGSDMNEVTSTNLTGIYDARLNNLTLKRLAVDGIDSKNTFGLFFINGGIGKNAIDIEERANVLVNHTSNNIATSVTITGLYFSESNTSAFKIEEVLGPVEAVATLTPETVEDNSTPLTLSFDRSISLSNASAPYFADNDGNKIKSAILSAVEGSETKISVSLEGLAENQYVLVLPEGTFTCDVDGKTRNVSLLKLPFSIYNPKGSGDDPELCEKYEPIYLYKSTLPGVPVTDVSLNDFTIYVYGTDPADLSVDNNKTIKLYDNRKDKIIKEGHLVPVDISNDINGAIAVKVQFEPEIVEGELRKDTYTIILERGTIGDANFGRYLNDKSSVKASDCLVNPLMKFSRYVNNAEATSIESTKQDDMNDTGIYDINGRKVNKISQSGVYIVNGKKYIKD